MHQQNQVGAWRPIAEAPIGPVLILGNETTGTSFPGYGYWQGAIPRPLWCSLHPDGVGRCKPTHFQMMPEMTATAQEAA